MTNDTGVLIWRQILRHILRIFRRYMLDDDDKEDDNDNKSTFN